MLQRPIGKDHARVLPAQGGPLSGTIEGNSTLSVTTADMESIEVPTVGNAHAPGGDDDGNDENGRKKPVVRKRTKTGCQSKCSPY